MDSLAPRRPLQLQFPGGVGDPQAALCHLRVHQPSGAWPWPPPLHRHTTFKDFQGSGAPQATSCAGHQRCDAAQGHSTFGATETSSEWPLRTNAAAVSPTTKTLWWRFLALLSRRWTEDSATEFAMLWCRDLSHGVAACLTVSRLVSACRGTGDDNKQLGWEKRKKKSCHRDEPRSRRLGEDRTRDARFRVLSTNHYTTRRRWKQRGSAGYMKKCGGGDCLLLASITLQIRADLNSCSFS
eukprot:scaffold2096_cov221-Pinguiococcus_pyrenoidosus.AAC.5